MARQHARQRTPLRIKRAPGPADPGVSPDARDGARRNPVAKALRALPALEKDHAFRRGGRGAAGADQRVVVLVGARAEPEGIAYRRGDQGFLLRWSALAGAHAAEVGEPEGVQTVVFDLTLAGRPGERCRCDADPGEDARRLAEALEQALGTARCTASLRAVAREGWATRSYPDLESLERDTPRELLRTA